MFAPRAWPRRAQALDDYRKIWEFGRTWDAEAYAARAHGLLEMRKDLTLQRTWKLSLDKMKTSLSAGCLQVSWFELGSALNPKPDQPERGLPAGELV